MPALWRFIAQLDMVMKVHYSLRICSEAKQGAGHRRRSHVIGADHRGPRQAAVASVSGTSGGGFDTKMHLV